MISSFWPEDIAASELTIFRQLLTLNLSDFLSISAIYWIRATWSSLPGLAVLKPSALPQKGAPFWEINTAIERK